jgi:hypothetical protein
LILIGQMCAPHFFNSLMAPPPSNPISVVRVALSSTIQAAPQVRDKKAELRRFIPMAVRRRQAAGGSSADGNPAKKPALAKATAAPVKSAKNTTSATTAAGGSAAKTKNKDALYSDFLSEMSDLL